ncbi:hypothetical protein BU15DRAFT_30429, partial [Melanogaster broomeanus]
WVDLRFENLMSPHTRYESSWYGPINILLNTYFPASDHFMVKPQARLHRQVEGDEPRTSVDSYGVPVQRRNNDDFPDFLVCSADSALHTDIPFLILEAKRDALQQGRGQPDRYLDWASKYQDAA